jgi:hypothetical protein
MRYNIIDSSINEEGITEINDVEVLGVGVFDKPSYALRLRELIMLAIGRASMCWSEMPRGVYDDGKAAKIGEKLVDDIIRIIEANNEKH